MENKIYTSISVEPKLYPTHLCCWNCNQGQGSNNDTALCCYAFCFPYCAYADIMNNLEENTCCCPVGFCSSLLCVLPLGIFSYTVYVACSAVIVYNLAIFVNYAGKTTEKSRRTLKRKYNLTTEECGCSSCAHICCFTCAMYQESMYIKHVLDKEPSCILYQCCNFICGKTEIGVFDRKKTMNYEYKKIPSVVTEQPIM